MGKVNSWLPLAALGASIAGAILMINPDPDHGRNGPPIFPGLLQPPGFEEFLPAAGDLIADIV